MKDIFFGDFCVDDDYRLWEVRKCNSVILKKVRLLRHKLKIQTGWPETTNNKIPTRHCTHWYRYNSFSTMLLASNLIRLSLFAAFSATVAGKDAIPPPLHETPPVPEASVPELEVINTFPLPNPEEVAVDPTQNFFVSGTNDGYVWKVDVATGNAEEIFSPKDFRPDYFADSTEQQVKELCDGSALPKENSCGRVLGIKFEKDADGACKKLWIVNAYFGIYESSCSAPWTLQKRIGIEGGFVNDIQPMGRYLYYTITHSTKQRNQLPYVVLDDEQPSGSLHRLDTENNFETLELAEDFYFANGLAVSTDGKSLYVSETTAARIRRYDIEADELVAYLEDIPVLTDNIIVQDGELLVPGYTRDATMEELLRDPEALLEFLEQGPAVVGPAFKAMVKPHGNLLIYDEATAKIKDRYFQQPGGKFALASSAHKLGDGYLLGSVFVPAATWIRPVASIGEDEVRVNLSTSAE